MSSKPVVEQPKTVDAEYRGMAVVTRKLHEALIRCCKGIITAWEIWLSQQ